MGASSDDFRWFRSCWTFVCTWVPGKRHALREDSRSWRLHQLQWSNECSKYNGFHVPRKTLHWKKTFANQLLIVLIRWLIQPMLLDRILRPVPVHLCWKVQQYIEELQREEWLNGPHGKGWMDCGKMLGVYMKMWNKALWFKHRIHTLNLGILQSYLKFQVVGFRKKLLQIECTFFLLPVSTVSNRWKGLWPELPLFSLVSCRTSQMFFVVVHKLQGTLSGVCT